MALVRVYCGVATAEMAPWLTVAVVDDSGRLLDVRHISDDPAGYAYLVALLAERSGGSCPIAMDRPDHLVVQLLAATHRPLALTDERGVHDFAIRFTDESSYDEMQAPPSQRRAIGLARAVQAGALPATAQSPSWDLDEVKPLLSAHAAVVTGRQAAAVALREVLREIYPAALRAYLDPAEFIPLKVLETFPEPGQLSDSTTSHGREQAVIAELAASGITDQATAANAVAALRAAVAESRGWHGNRLLAGAVAQTVRQAVAAVRAWDDATAALVGTLAERLNAMATGAFAPMAAGAPAPMAAGPMAAGAPVPVAAPVSPAVGRYAGMSDHANGQAAARAAVAVAPPGYPAAIPTPRPEPDYVPGRSDWPADQRAYAPAANGTNGASWEQQFGPAPGQPAAAAPQTYGPDTLAFSRDPLTAPLERPEAGDPLIFAQANSVWFNGNADTPAGWNNLPPDEGWRAAEQLTSPSVGPETTAGLPRRVPQANLVPGSATGPARQMRIVRDPKRIAAHTDGYFRGWRRGQEVGGFAVGQRDRGAWEFNREQRARQGAARLS